MMLADEARCGNDECPRRNKCARYSEDADYYAEFSLGVDGACDGYERKKFRHREVVDVAPRKQRAFQKKDAELTLAGSWVAPLAPEQMKEGAFKPRKSKAARVPRHASKGP